MSEKYYYVEPYLKTIDAKITGITNKGLILDRTISYPEGGGQPGDRGTINGIKYTDTIHDNDEIVHVIANPSSFKVGDSVTLNIDWAHRYD